MKHRIACLLCLALLLGACTASAHTSVLRRDDGLSMTLDNLSGVEAHALVLQEGDALFISSHLSGGEVDILIRMDRGETLYEGDGTMAPGQTLAVPATGIYRITVTGKAATGSLWIGVTSAQSEDGVAMPHTIARTQSALGYSLEYDMDYFTLETSEDGLIDYYTHKSDDTAAVLELSVTRVQGTLDGLAADLLREAGMTELEPQIIDWRPARILHLLEKDGVLQDYTLVETAQDEALLIVSTYFAGAEGAAEKMQNMIQSIGFTY